MAFQTNARRAQATQQRTRPDDGQNIPPREPRTDRSDRVKTGQRFPWDDEKLDRNGDGRIDFDDLVYGAKEVWQWLFSWRGGMFLSAGFTLMAGSINVASWSSATGSVLAGFLVFGMVQTLELMGTFDGMNVKSNLASLVRLQRKPVEIPVVNQTLNPAAKNRFKRYRNREKNQDMVLEAVKWICYGIEFSVLVVGGGILAPTGVSWGAALISLIGMVGVELGLWLVNICAEKLMTPEERAFIKELEGAVQRTSVKVASSN
jgi:hypothetical protein